MKTLAHSRIVPWILALGIAALTSCTGTEENEAEPVHRIAFQTTRDGNSEIYLVNPDGTGLVNLTRHDSLDYHPVGSPDGSMVAFISDRGGSRQIWAMNRDGSDPWQVTPDGPASIDPSFSRDGTQIAYHARSEAGDEEIFVIPTAGGAAVNISNHPATD
ncbi:MAG TPA: hypothetical protein VGA18_07285, partial [Rhodothermales bacterium]